MLGTTRGYVRSKKSVNPPPETLCETLSSWWFQPIWTNMIVQLDHFPKFRDEHEKYLSCHYPGPSCSLVPIIMPSIAYKWWRGRGAGEPLIPTRPGDFTHPTHCQLGNPVSGTHAEKTNNIDMTKIAIFERKAPFLVSMLDLGGVKICELGVLKLVLYS